MKNFKIVMAISLSILLGQMSFAEEGISSSEISTESAVQEQQESELAQEQKEIFPTNAQETYKDIEKTLGFVPEFLKKYPKEGITGAWIEMKQLEMGKTNLDAKNKQLVQLAVAGQVPCEYCVTFHSEKAKAYGATDDEISEVLALSGAVRSWSTVLNGLNVDQTKFKSDVARIVEGIKKQGKMAE